MRKEPKNQGKTTLPPALPNRKPHGNVSDMERLGVCCELEIETESLSPDTKLPKSWKDSKSARQPVCNTPFVGNWCLLISYCLVFI